MISRYSHKIIPSQVLKWIVAMIILIVMVFPIWWMFNVVFTEPGVPISINPRLYPSSLQAGIDNISQVLSDSKILHAFLISIGYVVFQVIGILLLSSMAAFEFALFKFPGKRFLFMLALLSMMIPAAVTLVPTYLLVVKIGWLNTLQGLVVPGLASAFGLFMMTQFMENLPRELFDAGEIDGLNHFGLFWQIALPLSKNAIITLAILQFVRTWGNYIWPLVIASNQQAYTISQVVGLYNNPMTYTTVNVIMATNLLATLPTILFYFFFQRFILEGIAMTGIKG
ncbi:carbohydrate ABC transporter membrane protein 2, CUT1 family [Longilinea arvoryzae]|uniref:Carbohydrate ABC transporter membrane protein 2, CUT1 family n=1 Tax=Longilinea arvoryzae TaxID=360412 RepID=A0A0S7B721_9CHLR|nr:carbohydrate ABC transporter permease [Longilinea arvoryzae]GAP13071.1 carbohydrate ABC transporter membrane protein 2, CUT1 family [Longilinea arvoryzae]